MKRKDPNWSQLSLRILALLAFLIVIILIPARMPLLGEQALEGLWQHLPFAGQLQISASYHLAVGRQLTAEDLDTIWSAHRPDAFTDRDETIGLYVMQPITKTHAILHSQVARRQVVAKETLGKHRQITADDVELALTPYHPLAYTDLGEFKIETDSARLYTQHPITKGLTLLSSAVAREYEIGSEVELQAVVVSGMQAGHQLGPGDLAMVYAAKRPNAFSSIDDLVGSTLAEDVSARTLILHSQVKRRQVVAKADLDTGHEITDADLELALTPYRQEAFTNVESVTGQFAVKAISKSLAIPDCLIDHKYVIATRELDAGQAIVGAAVRLDFCEDECVGGFTAVSQVIGSRPQERIGANSPIKRTDLERLQVVADTTLMPGTLLNDKHVRLAWTVYDDDAFPNPTTVQGLRLRLDIGDIKPDQVILPDHVEQPNVAFPRSHLEPNHLIDTVLDLEFKASKRLHGVFTSSEELFAYYTTQAIERTEDGGPILRDQVKKCQVVAANSVLAYHRIRATDLSVDPGTCKDVEEDLIERWIGGYALTTLEKGAAVTDAVVIPEADVSATGVVAFSVPMEGTLNGKLQPRDRVTIFLLQATSSQPGTEPNPEGIENCVILGVEKIEPGVGTSTQASAAESETGAMAQPIPQEPYYLIVAAIPEDALGGFVKWLPFSKVVLILP